MIRTAILVSFVVLAGLVTASADQTSRFVGSGRCQECHKETYDMWKETRHTKMVQVPSPENDNMAGDWQGTLKLGSPPGQGPAGAGGPPGASILPEATVRLKQLPGSVYQITLVDSRDSSREVTYTISRTLGGFWDKQRYMVKIGDLHYFAPVQWNNFEAKWGAYGLQNWYGEDGSLKEPESYRSFEMACIGCHVTGLVLNTDGDTYEATYSELNAGCEMCHGPGSTHVEAPTEGSIVNPGKLGYARAMDVCNQCHTAGVSLPNGSVGYPWNDKDNKPFVVGESLGDYLQGGSYGAPETYGNIRSGLWHNYPFNGHAEAEIRCFDCHNPHGGAGKHQLVDAVYNNNLCLSCHGAKLSDLRKIQEHTKHHYEPQRTGRSRCISCHDVNATPISGHFLEVITPMESLEDWKKNPDRVRANSCNGCHEEWSGEEAALLLGVEAYDRLFSNHKK